MVEHNRRQTIKVEGGQIIDQIKRLIHEGNVRRIVVKQGDHAIVEFPLTIGVIGVVLAPVLAAAGALAALLTDCALEVERVTDDDFAPVIAADAGALANGSPILSEPANEVLVP